MNEATEYPLRGVGQCGPAGWFCYSCSDMFSVNPIVNNLDDFKSVACERIQSMTISLSPRTIILGGDGLRRKCPTKGANSAVAASRRKDVLNGLHPMTKAPLSRASVSLATL